MKLGGVDGQIALRDYVSLALSFDYEIVYGTPAARFARRLKELVESGYGLGDSTKDPEWAGTKGASI